MSSPAARPDVPTFRSILRVVSTVVLSVLALYLVYLLREPLSWMVIALFVAVAASGPVNLLARRIPRGAAIAIVYFGIVLAPVAIGAILIPPAVEQGVKLAKNLPDYVDDLNQTINDNEDLQRLNEKYDLTKKLDDAADDLISELGNAPSALADIGAGIVSSIFALVTILVMSMFMVSRGRSWRDAALARRPPHQAERIRRATDRIAQAVASYVGGALAQATIAGAAAFLMLVILGVPSPLPLAVIIALLDLIPLTTGAPTAAASPLRACAPRSAPGRATGSGRACRAARPGRGPRRA